MKEKITGKADTSADLSTVNLKLSKRCRAVSGGYPPALPIGPPGLVMRQGSSNSASRLSGKTRCS
jgi:hypothetical protein